ncbi:ferritin-like domain-containing protein [Rhizohabitans arisaemae]|uniref:ferritin-like domain-containing protein n=1 Tax=Rhizohabitans arisaemae TaxID=2720610 RepID=UPI0024B27336|nr:ferritin-like domain-containing protein [Rhizohabitans arisaemae]
MNVDTALQEALAAEHAAVYAYGVIGAMVTGARRETARQGFAAHRTRRDQIRTVIVRRGGKPIEADPVYALPHPVGDAASAIRLAAFVEERMVASYLELVAADDEGVRRFAALAMQDCVTRGYGWRPTVTGAFPGMPGAQGATSAGTPQGTAPAQSSSAPPPAADPSPVPSAAP